jgi:hypothetical protein
MPGKPLSWMPDKRADEMTGRHCARTVRYADVRQWGDGRAEAAHAQRGGTVQGRYDMPMWGNGVMEARKRRTHKRARTTRMRVRVIV